MKKIKPKGTVIDDETMRREYDFSGQKGVRGKYYRAYRKGHSVRILEDDGTVTVRHFSLADGAVMLEPDVRAYFRNSAAVNKALRSLIAIAQSSGARRRPASSHR